MKSIKTKTTLRDIKVIDKTQAGLAHAKETYIRSKNQANETQSSKHDTPADYATSKASGGAKSAMVLAAGNLRKSPKRAVKNFKKAKSNFQEVKILSKKERQKSAQQAQKTAQQVKQKSDLTKSKAEKAKSVAEEAKKGVQEAKQNLQEVKQIGQQSVKSARQAEKRTIQSTQTTGKSVKQAEKSIKATRKGTVKTVKKSIKTAEKSAKTAVKTAHQTAKTAQQSAKTAAKAAVTAKKASIAATKASIAATKAAAKAVTAMIKAVIAAVKGLAALIAAGGWIVVLIIVVICMIGLLIGSIFGIFFSGEDAGDGGKTMSAVVAELTTEFYSQADEIIADNPHDVLDMSVMSINWSEVLAVYAVKVNTDPNNPIEVVTLNDDKINVLRDILNDMVTLSFSLETSEQERIITDDDGKEITETVTITTLIIGFDHKSAEVMATEYGFNQEQKNQMRELLSPDYADLWAVLLGGYSG